jgi:hypothetical protein
MHARRSLLGTLIALSLLIACDPTPAPPTPVVMTIGVRVVEAASQAPILGATVRYWFAGPTPADASSAQTDALGRVAFVVPRGVTDSHVFVTAEGYLPLSQHVDASPGLELQIGLDDVPAVRPRRGLARLEGRALVDDGGFFLGHGATLFWGLWGYQHDRGRLEENLAYLADSGAIDHVRVLATVGGPVWADRAVDPSAAGYDAALAGFTDLAFDKFGLRTEWTIFGGLDFTPTAAERQQLVDRVLAMSRGREEKIVLLETANEGAGNGFGGTAGINELRELTWRMNQATPILVAASSYHEDVDECCLVYWNGIADVATYHFDRTTRNVDGPWRPVRQPWGFPGEVSSCPDALPPGDSNEPIGPYSSIAEERDPTRLVAQAVVAHIAGLPLSVIHAGPGIWGGGASGQSRGIPANLWETPGLTDTLRGLAAVTAALPPDLPAWSKQNSGWAGSPFTVDALWPDGGDHGAVRVYSATRGAAFVTMVLGVKGYVVLTPRWPMTLEVRALTGGGPLEYALEAGAGLRLEQGSGAWLLTSK